MYVFFLWDINDCVTMSMNHFYDLPNDLQEKIYKRAHKIQSKDTFENEEIRKRLNTLEIACKSKLNPNAKPFIAKK